MKRHVRIGACCAVAVAACRAPTEITLQISTDIPCSELEGTSIAAGAFDEIEGLPPATTANDCKDGQIGSIVVVPAGTTDAAVAVRVIAGRGQDVETCRGPDYGPPAPSPTGCVVARRLLSFEPNDPLYLPILLRGTCVGVPCMPGSTCVGSACVDATLKDPKACATPGACGESALGASCGDTTSSAANCGRCGRSCGAAGVCQQGLCVPTQVNAMQDSSISAIAVDDAAVYWTTATDVVKHDRASSTETSLTGGQTNAGGIVHDGAGRLYWVDQAMPTSAAALRSIAVDGTKLVDHTTIDAQVSGMSANAMAVYWTEWNTGAVRRLPSGSSTPLTLATGDVTPADAQLDPTSVYWTDYNGSAIYRAPLGGGSVVTVVSGVGPHSLALNSSSVYWGDADMGVHAIAKAGGAPRLLTTTTSANFGPMAADDTWVYWAEPSVGNVVRASLDGSIVELLAKDQMNVHALVLDAIAVYWVTSDGHLMSLLK